ncbi:DUF4430 domain-containing protein [Filibacter tadaridae]|uniref:Transcobalamin-like C-terminal domain-containing protein n=1 Tax=Filibacter tadaridae TaxID=2483811 RepID=A0A3P5X3D3_9BACL|nr:DUF4430 domain-containing protein [Filibacter tadaridae]VDC25046.1 hypothetical protein FILTAD_01149 [Filibacter tadaridae]
MKRISRHLVLTLSVFLMVFIVSGCGSSLQKPTGLENEDQPIAEAVNDESQKAIEDETQDEETMPDATVQEKTRATSEKEATQKPGVDVKSANKTVEKPASDQQSKKPAATTKSPAVVHKPASESAKSTTATQPGAVKPAPTKPSPTKPAEPKPNKPATVPEAKTSKVVYSIVISGSEIPLAPTTMEIKDGDTVLKTLINITKKNKVQMDYRGGQGATAYVEGIDNVYEFDRGQGSGWMYRVNGIFPDRGAGVVKLLDGDRVEWLYTTNLGVDLNANLKPFRR